MDKDFIAQELHAIGWGFCLVLFIAFLTNAWFRFRIFELDALMIGCIAATYIAWYFRDKLKESLARDKQPKRF